MTASLETDCLLFREIPHTTELFVTFLENFDRLGKYYSHPPTDQGILAAARQVRFDAQTRRGVVEVLRQQNADLGAGEEATRNLDRLASGAVAIVTGQQVGVFSGPTYSFFKALCALRFADEITKRGVDAVPIFWLATEDHDLAEVNHTFWNSKSGLARLEWAATPDAEGRRVGEIALGQGIEPLVARAAEALEGPFAAEVGAALRESYTPADTFGSAYGKLMARLLAHRGLIFIDPLDIRLHRLAANVFRRALNEADSLREELMARSKELEVTGFHAQVKVSADSTLLFYNVNGKRQPVKASKGKFTAGNSQFSLDELDAAIDTRPDEITPSVLLRPVMQDTLLPTAAYIGGPAEVAYMAQVQVPYMRILGRMPAILPRSSFTLIEPTVARILSKYGLDLREVLQGSQHVRARMEQKAVPHALGNQFESDEGKLRSMLKSYAPPIEKLDPTLLGALESVEEKMLYQFTKLKEKVGRAENFRTGKVDEHQRILFDAIYPSHELQERSLCALPFIATYGSELLEELSRLSSIPTRSGDHACTHQHHILFL